MSDGSVVLAVLRLLVSLGAVLALLVVLARYAAKRGLGGARTGRGPVTLDVLSRRALGKASSVQVVQVGSRVMVLGVTDRSVSVLTELSEAELAQPEPAQCEPAQPEPAQSALARPTAAQPVRAGSFAAAVDRASVPPGVASPAAELPSRAARRRAVTPRPGQQLGWPWSAAALVLGHGRPRRG
jgi:flagellar protein FliO/FliZ